MRIFQKFTAFAAAGALATSPLCTFACSNFLPPQTTDEPPITAPAVHHTTPLDLPLPAANTPLVSEQTFNTFYRALSFASLAASVIDAAINPLTPLRALRLSVVFADAIYPLTQISREAVVDFITSTKATIEAQVSSIHSKMSSLYSDLETWVLVYTEIPQKLEKLTSYIQSIDLPSISKEDLTNYIHGLFSN
jgi:hypothetical protein